MKCFVIKLDYKKIQGLAYKFQQAPAIHRTCHYQRLSHSSAKLRNNSSLTATSSLHNGDIYNDAYYVRHARSRSIRLLAWPAVQLQRLFMVASQHQSARRYYTVWLTTSTAINQLAPDVLDRRYCVNAADNGHCLYTQTVATVHPDMADHNQHSTGNFINNIAENCTIHYPLLYPLTISLHQNIFVHLCNKKLQARTVKCRSSQLYTMQANTPQLSELRHYSEHYQTAKLWYNKNSLKLFEYQQINKMLTRTQLTELWVDQRPSW